MICNVDNFWNYIFRELLISCMFMCWPALYPKALLLQTELNLIVFKILPFTLKVFICIKLITAALVQFSWLMKLRCVCNMRQKKVSDCISCPKTPAPLKRLERFLEAEEHEMWFDSSSFLWNDSSFAFLRRKSVVVDLWVGLLKLKLGRN